MITFFFSPHWMARNNRTRSQQPFPLERNSISEKLFILLWWRKVRIGARSKKSSSFSDGFAYSRERENFFLPSSFSPHPQCGLEGTKGPCYHWPLHAPIETSAGKCKLSTFIKLMIQERIIRSILPSSSFLFHGMRGEGKNFSWRAEERKVFLFSCRSVRSNALCPSFLFARKTNWGIETGEEEEFILHVYWCWLRHLWLPAPTNPFLPFFPLWLAISPRGQKRVSVVMWKDFSQIPLLTTFSCDDTYSHRCPSAYLHGLREWTDVSQEEEEKRSPIFWCEKGRKWCCP